MRKISFILAVLFVIGTLKVSAYDAYIDGIYYNLDSVNHTACVTYCNGSPYTGSVDIPNLVTNAGVSYTVTEIGEYAFNQNFNLTAITMSDSITSIGDFAFYSCNSLTSLNFPNSVTSVGLFAFSATGITSPVFNNTIFAYMPRSYSQTSYTVPNGITKIASCAFLGCGLDTVILPASLTSIGDQAFSGCTSLQTVNIPNSVTNIGTNAFCNTDITIPIYNNTVFAYMPTSYCVSYLIPNGIKKIAGGAFYNCESINSVSIPASVDTIGDYAFNNCSKLASVHCDNTTPPSCTVRSFSALPATATLYVPYGTAEVYSTAVGWSNFNPNIKSPYHISVYTEDYDKGTVSGDSMYMANSYAIIYGCPNHGYRFSRWNDGNRNNPRILEVTCDSSFTAYFMPDTFRVSARVSDATMGSVSGSGKYAYRDVATLSATASNGYVFRHWDNGETASTIFVDVESDTVVTAVFSPAGAAVDDVSAGEYDIYPEGNEIVISGDVNYAAVYDASGKLIACKEIRETTMRVDVPVSGVYFIRLNCRSGKIINEKIVVR